MCFPVSFVEFLRTPFLQKTSGGLQFGNLSGEDRITEVNKIA